MNDKIVVVDFGSQYNQVIVKSLRKLKIYSVLVAYDEIKEYLKMNEVSGIILSGGPMSVYDKKSYTLNEEFFSTNVPILGVCYGMQYLVHSL
ncbi:MAG: glutamine amidotransferase-related protein, partial [Mycoplasmatales bacterium]